MAFSGFTQRGTAAEKVSDTTHTMNPTGTIAAGKLAIVAVAIDNIATADGNTTETTISDNAGGNTWTRAYERANSTGTAGSGETVGVHFCVLSTQLTTSSVVTLTTSAATTCKLFDLNEFTITESSVQVSTNGTNFTEASGVGADLGDCTLSSMSNIEHLLIAVVGVEEETVSLTQDADYTQMSTNNTGTGGATLTNLMRWSAYRIATLTTDTYNPATSGGLAAADYLEILVALEEVSAAAATSLLIPTGMPQAILVQ